MKRQPEVGVARTATFPRFAGFTSEELLRMLEQLETARGMLLHPQSPDDPDPNVSALLLRATPEALYREADVSSSCSCIRCFPEAWPIDLSSAQPFHSGRRSPTKGIRDPEVQDALRAEEVASTLTERGSMEAR